MASRPRGRPYVSLRGRSEFARVYRDGRQHRRGRIMVVATVGLPGPSQVAFVAGRRVGTAVERNRAKRRLREAATRAMLCEDMAYIVIAQPGVNDAPFDDLVEWLSSAAAQSAAAHDAVVQPTAVMEETT